MAEPTGYAVVQDDVVINVVIWDGGPEWTPPAGCIAVALGDSGAGIGWGYVNGQFIPPAPEPE
jgi:hypothetical protein